MSAAADSAAARLGRLRAALRSSSPAPARVQAAPADPPPPPGRSAGLPPSRPITPVDVALDLAPRSSEKLSSLLERLASRARNRAVSPRAAAAARLAPDDLTLARQLGARIQAPGVLAFDHEHPLAPAATPLEQDLHPLGLTAPGLQAADLCFIDTETSGLAGGCGTLPFLVGVARLRGGVLQVRQWLLTGFVGEREMLRALLEHSAGAGAWVSYNGKSFDLPLLATRLALARLDPLPPSRPHADLLHAVRVAYGRHWPDCRLATAEARLLGRAREADLPGHAVPAAWTAFLREGAVDALPAVLLHNRLDLISLAELLPVLGALYAPSGPHPALARPRACASADHGAIARSHLRRGLPASALRQLESARGSLDDRARLLHADLLRRSGRLPEALALWEQLAARDVLPAVVALLRHDRRAPGQALHWATRLCTLAPADPRHRRRIARLARASAGARSLPLPGLDDPGKK